MNFYEDLKNRTKELAKNIIFFYLKLNKSDENRILGRQLLRSATSVASNFRAVCRARSDKERFAKLSIVVEEADETLFWLELFEETKLVELRIIESLKTETEQLFKIFSSYRKNIKIN